MPAVTNMEATEVVDSILWTLYGEHLFEKWVMTKIDMNFTSERDYVAWLLELADTYNNTSLLQSAPPEQPRNSEEGRVARPRQSFEANKCYPAEVKGEATSDMAEINNDSETMKGGVELPPHHQGTGGYDQVTEEVLLSDDEEYVGMESESGKLHEEGASSASYLMDSPSTHSNIPSGDGDYSHTFQCQYCVFSCRKRFALISHNIYKHGAKAPHTCATCGRGFAVPSRLRLHEAKCALQARPLYNCAPRAKELQYQVD